MKRTKGISIVVLFVTMCILFVFSSVSFATVNGDELVDSMYTEDIDGWTNWLEVASDSWYDSGDGTIKEFTINTAEELAGLTKLVYEGNSFSGEKIILGKDISLEGKKWTPIGYGDGGDYFIGEFDGSGKTISNITIVGEGESQRLGFFRKISASAHVHDLNLKDVQIYGGDSKARIGALAGDIMNSSSSVDKSTLFENISLDGFFFRGSGTYVGGITGLMQYTTYSNISVNNVLIEITADESASNAYGGIIGRTYQGLVKAGSKPLIGNNITIKTVDEGNSNNPIGVGGFIGWDTHTWVGRSVSGDNITINVTNNYNAATDGSNQGNRNGIGGVVGLTNFNGAPGVGECTLTNLNITVNGSGNFKVGGLYGTSGASYANSKCYVQGTITNNGTCTGSDIGGGFGLNWRGGTTVNENIIIDVDIISNAGNVGAYMGRGHGGVYRNIDASSVNINGVPATDLIGSINTVNNVSVSNSNPPVGKAYIKNSSGTSIYDSLDAAIKAAVDGETIQLIGDSKGKGLVIDKNIIIDLGAHIYEINTGITSGDSISGIQILEGISVTIKNGTIKLEDSNELVGILLENYADLILENVVLDGTNLKDDSEAVFVSRSGDSIINGNTDIVAKDYDEDVAILVEKTNADSDVSLTIDTTGQIKGKILLIGFDELSSEEEGILIENGNYTDDVSKYLTANSTANYIWIYTLKTSKDIVKTNEEFKVDIFIKGNDIKGANWTIDFDTEYFELIKLESQYEKTSGDELSPEFEVSETALDLTKPIATYTLKSKTEKATDSLITIVKAGFKTQDDVWKLSDNENAFEMQGKEIDVELRKFDTKIYNGSEEILGNIIETEGKTYSFFVKGYEDEVEVEGTDIKYLLNNTVIDASEILNISNVGVYVIGYEIIKDGYENFSGEFTLTITKKEAVQQTSGSSVTKYKITVKKSEGGTITPNSYNVRKGSNKTFEITPNEGFEIIDVLVDGESIGAVESYTFKKVKSKHTIEAIFKKIEEVIEDTWKNPFTDVDENDWFYEAVKYANENGIMNGMTENTFDPSYNMTRGMIVTVLYRLENEPAINKSIPFDDVDLSMYYGNAVIWAKQNNIVNGMDENNFMPNASITREQLTTILYRYAKYKGKDVNVRENTNISSYDDFNEISEYAISATQWACGTGIIKGRTESTLVPKETTTRAEVATMIMRFAK